MGYIKFMVVNVTAIQKSLRQVSIIENDVEA